MPEYTPGPWEWRIKKKIQVDPKDDDYGFFVGDLSHPTSKTSGTLVVSLGKNKYGVEDIICFKEADANLIATSPILIGWLKWLRENLVTVDNYPHNITIDDIKLDDAILRAEGKNG